MKNWKGIYISGVPVLALLVSSVNAAEIQPHRIVSVGGAITEIIYALGSENRIVGVDSSSLWPQQARSFPQIGYQRALSAEGILSLSPDLILATEDAGPLATLAQLKKVGVRLTVVPNKTTIDGILGKISAVAEAIGKKSEGIVQLLMGMASKCGSPFDAFGIVQMDGFSIELSFDVGPIEYNSMTRIQTYRSGLTLTRTFPFARRM